VKNNPSDKIYSFYAISFMNKTDQYYTNHVNFRSNSPFIHIAKDIKIKSGVDVIVDLVAEL
jgi:hypothetical protein